MKKIFILIIIVVASTGEGQAQTLNWRSIDKDQKNLAYFNFGYDFGTTAQLGYGRLIKVFRPILLGMDYSSPMGKKLTDDFKIRYGAQIEVIERNGFSLTAKVLGNFRRFENSLVRITSFGSEFSTVAGYYKTSWHIAAEIGYDKSIISNLKHSDTMRDIYSEVTDGWYIPTGGHYFYGIQASKTLGKSFDISMRLGMTNAEKKDENAQMPFYGQLGLIKKF
ncbi:hypothetical protein [Aquimarina sp. 2304DJ70-9]|uniref:hypothetical protein n=1 Tax=Aquimarina penaris TaxID=3231044 RepID=UPI0034634800